MKAVILARVSTEMQEDGFSLDAQLDRLRRYCERHNLDIIQEYNITESSTKGKRPQFNEMLTFVKKQRERIAVVVDAVDRLQRSFKETPILNDLIEQGKIELHFLREAMVVNDRTKNTQKVMWDMCVLMAKAYVGALADNVKRAEEKMLKEGLLAGPAPIGYLNTRDENGKKTIIIDPDRGHFIKKLFEEYSTGLFSMDELVKKSKSWGLRNKTTAHNPISKSQFANILQNPFYYGVMYYNKEYHPHCYEKLISKELFDKCTEVRTGKFKRTSKHTKEPYIFRGLVRCKHCGCLLSPYTKKDKYVYLRHTDLKNCEHCNNVSEKVLLKDVEKSLSSIHFDDDLKAALAVRLKKQYEATHGNTYYQLEKNRNELADVEENQKKLLDLLISGTVPAEVYRSKNAEYETAKIELQAKIEKLQMPDTSVERAIDKVLNFSQNSFAIFKSSQIEEKRRILNIVFANFFMDGKNPEISMRKNFKLLSKIGACKDWCPGEDSNFHCLRQHAPEACASTNFATRASITDILLSHFKINCKHLFQKIIKISIRI
mgnify:FL=1